jgi:hypothetical protein
MKTNPKKETEKTEKFCSICKVIHPIEMFGKLKASPDGYLTFCKASNQARNKAYRLSLTEVEKPAKEPKTKLPMAVKSVKTSWDKAPVKVHEVRFGNDVSLGDYFKLGHVKENFILQVKVWDIEGLDKKVDVSNHKLYVTAEKWNQMVDFRNAEEMKRELSNVTDATWNPFVRKYGQLYNEAAPSGTRLIGLRFKKHGSTGKCVNCGFSLKTIPALEKEFSK